MQLKIDQELLLTDPRKHHGLLPVWLTYLQASRTRYYGTLAIMIFTAFSLSKLARLSTGTPGQFSGHAPEAG